MQPAVYGVAWYFHFFHCTMQSTDMFPVGAVKLFHFKVDKSHQTKYTASVRYVARNMLAWYTNFHARTTSLPLLSRPALLLLYAPRTLFRL
jgi:hypothetical protein